MKKLSQIHELDGEGLDLLLGERVLILCAGYFYEGLLVGVSETFVKLEDPSIVYSVGAWADKLYSDIQKLHQKEWYVPRGLIESLSGSRSWSVK